MLYKNARNKVKPEMRKSKYTYESDLASKIKTDPKLFWAKELDGEMTRMRLQGSSGLDWRRLRKKRQKRKQL